MSLNINVDDVTSVLLADGWHEVIDKSFVIDAYEFLDGGKTHSFRKGVYSTGARWKGKGGESIACPIRSIVAIKCQG